MLRLVIYLNEDEDVLHSSQTGLGRRATRDRETRDREREREREKSERERERVSKAKREGRSHVALVSSEFQCRVFKLVFDLRAVPRTRFAYYTLLAQSTKLCYSGLCYICHVTLYCAVLHYTILYYAVPYETARYVTILCYTMLSYTIHMVYSIYDILSLQLLKRKG